MAFPLSLANFLVALQWFIYGSQLKDQFIQVAVRLFVVSLVDNNIIPWMLITLYTQLSNLFTGQKNDSNADFCLYLLNTLTESKIFW